LNSKDEDLEDHVSIYASVEEFGISITE